MPYVYQQQPSIVQRRTRKDELNSYIVNGCIYTKQVFHSYYVVQFDHVDCCLVTMSKTVE